MALVLTSFSVSVSTRLMLIFPLKLISAFEWGEFLQEEKEGVREVARILHVRLVVFGDVSVGCAHVIRLEVLV
jgi:hypothetical protein